MKVTPYITGKISEPGCYSGLPLDFYHDDCTAGPGISSSGLRTIESKTPLHYWATSYLNPDRIEQEPKDHFTFGEAAHKLLLGESGFAGRFSVRPDKWDSWRTDKAKEWKAEQESEGRTVLIPSQLEQIRGMARSLAAEAQSNELFVQR